MELLMLFVLSMLTRDAGLDLYIVYVHVSSPKGPGFGLLLLSYTTWWIADYDPWFTRLFAKQSCMVFFLVLIGYAGYEYALFWIILKYTCICICIKIRRCISISKHNMDMCVYVSTQFALLGSGFVYGFGAIIMEPSPTWLGTGHWPRWAQVEPILQHTAAYYLQGAPSGQTMVMPL